MTEGEESSGHALQDNNLVGDYIVEGNVGQGSYGKVKLAYHRATRHQVNSPPPLYELISRRDDEEVLTRRGACRVMIRQVAIKILQKDLMDSAEQERSRREIAIQRKLIHPNIAKLYDVIESEDRINIVMEYSEGGELLTYITKQGKLNENEARRLFLQLLSAVQYCHSHNIIHRYGRHRPIDSSFPAHHRSN
jgi:carbon catabolite-derepressing protein kinase